MREIARIIKNHQEVFDSIKGVEIVFHLAANPEVRLELCDPKTCFRENVYSTHVVLEAIRKSDVKTLAFISSSTVYGDAEMIPTPEDYPPKPISVYGASKLASESLITAYAHTYGFKAVIYRLANIVGPRSKHGVIHDFLQKPREKSEETRNTWRRNTAEVISI